MSPSVSPPGCKGHPLVRMHLVDYKLGGRSVVVDNLAVMYSGVNTRFNAQVERPVQAAVGRHDR